MDNPDWIGYLERSSQMETAMAQPQAPTSYLQATGKSFGIRAGAYILDTVVLYAVNFTVSFMVGLITSLIYAVLTGQVLNLAGQDNLFLNILLGFVLMTLYYTMFEWLYGATPGKLILGMRVIKEDGSPCSLGSAFIRALLRMIDGLFLGLVAYQTMNEPLYQRLGDKSAKTIVVGSKDAAIQQPRPWWEFVVAAVSYLAINTVVMFFWIIALTR
jgi:uncharacterized RDD family membrane protein YckC